MLNINDYKYDLPDDRIARYPLASRDASKLLVYNKGEITHTRFQHLPDFLPENSFLFFNDTKVIPARIHFKKETGAVIEIFLLSPVSPSPVLSVTMQSTVRCTWKCAIGNLKRWTRETKLTSETQDTMLHASLLDKDEGLVSFEWSGEITFAEVVNKFGETPLPPYLKRDAEKSDRERYQTIYSHFEGAVAAPTAGLHFTEHIFRSLNEKNIQHDFLTLHVGAGTFQPVKSANAEEHTMHPEQIIVTQKNIENLLRNDKFLIAVGTTSMRTMESLFWFGSKLFKNPKADFKIRQDDPYTDGELPSTHDSLMAIKKHMEVTHQDFIRGETSIFIKPGYTFRICKGLITNFHQPASTLILLVAAFIGNDWQNVYNEALQNDYRFLSYGDSSLLIP